MADQTIDRLGQSVTIVREEVSETLSHGVVSPGATQTIVIQAVVVPADGQKMLLLPEGERGEDTISLYTTTQLQETNSALGTASDIVLWSGRQYRVSLVRAWGQFWEALAVRTGR